MATQARLTRYAPKVFHPPRERWTSGAREDKKCQNFTFVFVYPKKVQSTKQPSSSTMVRRRTSCGTFGGNNGRRLSEFGCGRLRAQHCATLQFQTSGDYHSTHGANVPTAQKQQHGGRNGARSAWEPAKNGGSLTWPECQSKRLREASLRAQATPCTPKSLQASGLTSSSSPHASAYKRGWAHMVLRTGGTLNASCRTGTHLSHERDAIDGRAYVVATRAISRRWLR